MLYIYSFCLAFATIARFAVHKSKDAGVLSHAIKYEAVASIGVLGRSGLCDA